ncbi:MAG: hypothetical protein ABSF34_18100 [Verrucomicrobiota bacterium]
MKNLLAILFNISSTAMLVLICGTPALMAWLPIRLLPGIWIFAGVFFAPFIYALGFVLTAGLLSRPFRSGIVAGKFPRDLSHPVYRKRRYYGICWTALYYCKPIYYLCLTIPWLKWLTFRLFGYRGQMDFTVYPDTWLRDLPLLDLGKGVYIANRATLGTNMPLNNGKILVEGIKIGSRSLVGHLTMLAAGVELGEDTQIESGCALGMFVKMGSRCGLGGTVTVEHYAQIGDDAFMGTSSYLGFRARLPNGATIPPFTSLSKQGTSEGKSK